MGKLNYELDNLDGLDDATKALYTEKDGKFRLDVDGVPEDAGLKKRVGDLTRESIDRRKKLEPYEKLGKTPEELAEILAGLEQEEVNKANKKGDWEGLKAQMNTQHQKELEKRDGIIKGLKTTLQEELIDNRAKSVILEEKGSVELLLPIIRNQARMVEEDGKYHVRFFDGDVLRVNSAGNPVTIKDVVQGLKASDAYGRAFDGTGGSGSNSRGGGGSGGSNGTKKRSQMTTAEKAAYIKEHGHEGYMALPV